MKRFLLVVGVIGGMMIISSASATAASLVTSAQIKNGTIRSIDVKDGSLTGADVKNSSLTSADIKDGSVTRTDVAPSSLTGANIKDGTIGLADLDAATRARLVPAGTLVAVFSSQACPAGSTNAGTIVGQDYGSYWFGTPTTVIDTFSSTWSLSGLNTKQNASAVMTKLTLCRVG